LLALRLSLGLLLLVWGSDKLASPEHGVQVAEHFPSLIIFAAVIVLMAVGDDDRFVLGRRRPASVNRS
jgi:hypothetical protein